VDWPQRGGGTVQSTEVLRPLPGESASPFDALTRHSPALSLLRAAYHDDMAFSEMSIIVKQGRGSGSAAEAVPSHAAWHHDGHHPECSTSLMQSSVIYYLTDVPADGACFTVVPGSHMSSRCAFPTTFTHSLLLSCGHILQHLWGIISNLGLIPCPTD